MNLIKFDSYKSNPPIRSSGVMSYPFFRCVSCKVPVQEEAQYVTGKLPSRVLLHSSIPLSGVFDTDQVFSFCRGQGMRYSEADHPRTMEYIRGYHYNFSGLFKGYCCLCAFHAEFSVESFMDAGCYSCKQKRAVVAEFIELTKTKSGESVSWRTHGWAALPSVILDRIVSRLFDDQVAVLDGVLCPPKPQENSE